MLSPLPHPPATTSVSRDLAVLERATARPTSARLQCPQPELLLERPAGTLRSGTVVVNAGLAAVLGHQGDDHMCVIRSAGSSGRGGLPPTGTGPEQCRRRIASRPRTARRSHATARQSALPLTDVAPASSATRAHHGSPPASRQGHAPRSSPAFRTARAAHPETGPGRRRRARSAPGPRPSARPRAIQPPGAGARAPRACPYRSSSGVPRPSSPRA